jgi:hypothetical protein
VSQRDEVSEALVSDVHIDDDRVELHEVGAHQHLHAGCQKRTANRSLHVCAVLMEHDLAAIARGKAEA